MLHFKHQIGTYPVQYDDPFLEILSVLLGSDGNVVEEAEAEGLVAFRMVAWRPDQTKSVSQRP